MGEETTTLRAGRLPARVEAGSGSIPISISKSVGASIGAGGRLERRRRQVQRRLTTVLGTAPWRVVEVALVLVLGGAFRLSWKGPGIIGHGSSTALAELQ